MLFLAMVLTQSGLCEKHMFYKTAPISAPRKSPDMICTAFHVKFHAWKNGIPPMPVDHQQTIRKISYK